EAIVLTWLPAHRASYYVISRAEGLDPQTFEEVVRIEAPATSWSDTGLKGWTYYSYQIYAVNGGGPAYPSETQPIKVFGAPSVVNLGPVSLPPLALNSSTVSGQTFRANRSGQLMGIE